MHNFEQRLARWLLMSADRAHVETFKMSQEFLSHMLGSSRPFFRSFQKLNDSFGSMAFLTARHQNKIQTNAG